MNTILLFVKLLLKFISWLLLHIYWLFPVKQKRIVFESFNANKIACNPLYIYKELKNIEGLDLCWMVSSVCEQNLDAIYVNYSNIFIRYYYYLTAKFVITNMQIPDYLPFRKEQILINTWHGGGAYKKVALSIKRNFLINIYMKISCSLLNKFRYYFLSSSFMFSKVMKEAFNLEDRQFLPFGMPRNDVFFDFDKIKSGRKKVESQLGINPSAYIVLYAPTYRGNFKNPVFYNSIDVDGVRECVKDKYCVNNVVFLFRGHHTFLDKIKIDKNDNFIDVSDYPDMQELLVSADMLISDYSSCIWDYSFINRPCLLYVPDLLLYQQNTDFYFPIDTWGFPYALDNDSLLTAIKNLDNENIIYMMYKHHINLGSYEQGNASVLLRQFLLDNIN